MNGRLNESSLPQSRLAMCETRLRRAVLRCVCQVFIVAFHLELIPNILQALPADLATVAPDVLQEFAEVKRFEPGLKTPCWHTTGNHLRCLPYFAIIGECTVWTAHKELRD